MAKIKVPLGPVTVKVKSFFSTFTPEGIITGFSPHINIAKLGYGAHKIYLNFKSLSKEKEEEMWNYLVRKENIVWVISCSGRWNLIFGIASKNIEEFNKILSLISFFNCFIL